MAEDNLCNVCNLKPAKYNAQGTFVCEDCVEGEVEHCGWDNIDKIADIEKAQARIKEKEMKPEEIYDMAIEKWGIPLQLGMVIEEASELIKAVCKVQRGKPDAYKQLAEEVADMEIMLGQLHRVFKDGNFSHEVEVQKRIKLRRLEGLFK